MSNVLTFIYVLAVIAWLGFIFVIIRKPTLMGSLILLLPLITLSVSYVHAENYEPELNEKVCGANIISCVFLVVIILIHWNRSRAVYYRNRFLHLAAIAFVLLIISLYDIWLPDDKLKYWQHVRVILQTFSLTLVAYVIYDFYAWHHQWVIHNNAEGHEMENERKYNGIAWQIF